MPLQNSRTNFFNVTVSSIFILHFIFFFLTFFTFIFYSLSIHNFNDGLYVTNTRSIHLHMGDNPGAILVTTPPDGSNYQSWSRSIRELIFI
ncbi:putative gag-polypeptide of LTR copia-type [Lupinus albus]|uniref:Putative gag-polypeptide of LTR copia-type n=1 Tax=Lupinus albus TaxID=3870 RepID=A0A6A4R7J9_LUPAL|nr:putative gag-polypeptide of LTR copia-type [Lupinus albus]